MHVLTKAQISEINLAADDTQTLAAAFNAAHALNDILDDFDTMTQEQREQRADRLRAFADLVDGHTTARGNQHTYSY